jgi:hypothetical protein
MLERDLHWSGVCIEANNAEYSNLIYRKCTNVLGSAVSNATGDIVKFRNHGTKGGIANVGAGAASNPRSFRLKRLLRSPTKDVVTLKLADILDAVGAPRVIDFLSLDVEGAEEQVL